MNEIICVSFSLLCFKACIAFLFVRFFFLSPIPTETRVYWYIHVKSIDHRPVSSHSTVQPAVFNLLCRQSESELSTRENRFFFIFSCSFTYLPFLGSFHYFLWTLIQTFLSMYQINCMDFKWKISTFTIDIMGTHLYGARFAFCIYFYFLVSLCLLFTFSCPDSMWMMNMQSSAVNRQFFRGKIQLFSPQLKSKTCTETWSIHSIIRCCYAIDINIESKLININANFHWKLLA